MTFLFQKFQTKTRVYCSKDATIEQSLISFAQNVTVALSRHNQDSKTSPVSYGLPNALLAILSTEDCSHSKDCSHSMARALFQVVAADTLFSDLVVNGGGIEILCQLLSKSKHDPTLLYCSKALTVLALTKHQSSFCTPGAVVLISLMELLQDIFASLCNARYEHSYSPDCIASVILALANVALLSDANKTMVSNKTSILTKIVMNHRTNKRMTSSLAALICNASFRNPYASYNFLQGDLVDTIIDDCLTLDFGNISLEEHTLLERVMIMCANLSNSPQNRCLLYSIENCIGLITRVLENADDCSLLKSASHACASICYDASASRRSFGKDGIAALIDIILRLGLYDENENDVNESEVAEAASWALGSLLIDDMVLERGKESSEDLISLTQLYSQTQSTNRVLVGGAMVVAGMLPNVHKKKELLAEGRLSFIENEGGEKVLLRCKAESYHNDDDVMPLWLKNALNTTSMKEQDSFVSGDGGNASTSVTFSEPDMSDYFPHEVLFQIKQIHLTPEAPRH